MKTNSGETNLVIISKICFISSKKWYYKKLKMLVHVGIFKNFAMVSQIL